MYSEFDFINLTHEELQEEYTKLQQRYMQLREINEADAQLIHELKRNIETANAAEVFLAQELDQLNSSLQKVEQNVKTKMEHKLEDLRCKYNKVSAENMQLQQECADLEMKCNELQKQLERVSLSRPPDVFETLSEHQLKRERQLEQENLYLLEKLEEFQESNIRQTMTLAEREKIIEILRDQVKCMEENIRSKREELEEITQLLESTQEQLLESNSQIALLTATPGSNDKKGNSLFAEVDDQRQAMKQLLAAQKKSYMQMKKVFNESEHEIRRLKRENIAMHTELQACSSIFCSADKTYQEKLNERIKHLLNQNEKLAQKLSWTQDRLKEVASDKGVIWLDSMMNFCKQETDELKKNLHSVRIQNASLEEQLRNSQQEMARWRFESLKSRCVLMDRENLLMENKIDFMPIVALEVGISESELVSSRPRIHSVSGINSSKVLCMKNEETYKSNCAADSIETIATTHESLSNNQLEEFKNKENSQVSLSEQVKNLNIKEHTYVDRDQNNACITLNSLEDTQIETIKVDADSEVTTSTAVRSKSHSASCISKMDSTSSTQSILCKNKSLISKETSKTVQFSAIEADSINRTPVSKNDFKVTATPKFHKKSNVIVRRVVVKSKHET